MLPLLLVRDDAALQPRVALFQVTDPPAIIDGALRQLPVLGPQVQRDVPELRRLGLKAHEELAALVQERCFYHLEAPVQRATGFDTPYPHSLEWAYFPGPVRIGTAIRKAVEA